MMLCWACLRCECFKTKTISPHASSLVKQKINVVLVVKFEETVYAMLIYLAHVSIVHAHSFTELKPAGMILTHRHSLWFASSGPYIMNLIDSLCPP